MVRVPRRIREPLERSLDEAIAYLHDKIVEHRAAAREAQRKGDDALATNHLALVASTQLGLRVLKISRQQSTPPAPIAAESFAP